MHASPQSHDLRLARRSHSGAPHMPTYDPFEIFDPTRYQSVPNLPLQSMITLTKALLAATPKTASPRVKHLAALLSNTAVEAETAMIVRLREDNQGAATSDLAFDHAVDTLWSLLRDRLSGWIVYGRSALDYLDADVNTPAEVDIAKLRSKATRAEQIGERLFGSEGLKFLVRPYVEQSQLMANVLGLIDADNLEADLLELTGPELLPLLRHCQTRYEAMVQARAMREAGSGTDLRVLRGQLRRFISRYAGAVISMLDESAPETLSVVETALMPMITIGPSVGAAAVEVDASESQPDPSPPAS
jgi:hypothetical protein